MKKSDSSSAESETFSEANEQNGSNDIMEEFYSRTDEILYLALWHINNTAKYHRNEENFKSAQDISEQLLELIEQLGDYKSIVFNNNTLRDFFRNIDQIHRSSGKKEVAKRAYGLYKSIPKESSK